MRMIRIYLDNCCFNRPFDDKENIKVKLESIAKLHVQSLIKEQKIELAWSYILEAENDKNPFPDRHLSIREWKEIACINLEETEDLLLKAEDILQVGIKTLDAVHLACSIFTNCNYFLTTDKGIINKAKHIREIEIVNPIDFVNILEGL